MEPLLIDRIVARGNGNHLPGGQMANNLFNTIKNARMNSERFVFTPEASDLLGQFAMNDGDLLIDNRQFAIPPYPNCYVELSARDFFKHAKQDSTPRELRDHRLAYLNIGPYVYVMFSREGNSDPYGIAFWRYKILPPGQHAGISTVKFDINEYVKIFEDWLRNQPEILEMLEGRYDNPIEVYEEAFRLDLYLGGNTPINTPKKYLKALPILDEVSMQWIVPDSHPIHGDFKQLARYMQSFFGDIRNFYAIHLWLNQQQRIRLIGVPPGRKIVRGKLMPYLRYNTVTIDIGKCKTVRRAFQLSNERASPVGHKVRGHWRHRGGKRSCIHEEGHDWPLHPDERGHFTCRHCKLERYWVKDHSRGDASKGYVQKHYEVAA